MLMSAMVAEDDVLTRSSSTNGRDHPFLTVVIPAYNEAGRLPATLDRIFHYLNQQEYSAQVIVVDDGSTDGTAAAARRYDEKHHRVEVIENPHHGKGATVRRGMLAAHGDIVLFSDADLSTPIEELERMLPWFEKGYDVVIGSREGTGARRYDEPFYRHFMGRVFNTLVRLLAVQAIQDTQCGFKAFRREVAHDLFSRMRLYTGDGKTVVGPMVTAFDVEILYLAQRLGYRIREVPVEWYYSNETKVNPLRDSWRNLRDVLAVRWNALRGVYND
ncbi:MAG: dolichyl-phosphate beta-glucosyltransferase [Anaerolineae bacterium]